MIGQGKLKSKAKNQKSQTKTENPKPKTKTQNQKPSHSKPVARILTNRSH
jgi:hypothetical protein